MSVGYRDESGAQLTGSDRTSDSGADVTATRVASCKIIDTPRAE